MRTLKKDKREARRKRIRARVSGTAKHPRLAVFRSNKHIYAQIINDERGETLVSTSDVKIGKGKKTEKARLVGIEIAKDAKAKNISRVVFDRGGFLYAGRVKEVAEGARAEGLEF